MGPNLDELRSGAGSRHRCFTEVESYMVRYRRQRNVFVWTQPRLSLLSLPQK